MNRKHKWFESNNTKITLCVLEHRNSEMGGVLAMQNQLGGYSGSKQGGGNQATSDGPVLTFNKSYLFMHAGLD